METKQVSNQLLTVKEAAARLRVSPFTIREWARLRKIRAVKFSSRLIRFEVETLNQWIRLHRC